MGLTENLHLSRDDRYGTLIGDYWHLQGVQRVAILSVRDLAAYSPIWASYLGGMTYIPLNARATTEQLKRR